MASKLLLLPLVPALAFGIVEVASRISMPTPTAAPTVVVIDRPAPVTRVIEPIEPPPAPPPEPACRGCTAAE
jgi:hypothetical protein